jgi:hypothetical protein
MKQAWRARARHLLDRVRGWPRGWRLLVGGGLVLAGAVGFLPVVGFWMLPLGLLVLSMDLPLLRRGRRRLEVWWFRRRR